MFQQKQLHIGRRSVAIIKLGAQMSEGVLSTCATLLTLKQQGVWHYDALQRIGLTKLYHKLFLRLQQSCGPGRHVKPTRQSSILLRKHRLGDDSMERGQVWAVQDVLLETDRPLIFVLIFLSIIMLKINVCKRVKDEKGFPSIK